MIARWSDRPGGAPKRTNGVLVCALVLAMMSGCKEKTPPPADVRVDAGGADVGAVSTVPKLEIEHDEGPQPTADTVIAKAGEHQVTMADYDEATQVSLLFSPTPLAEMPPERLALPHVHLTMTRALLGNELMVAEAKRRGIEPTREELVAWLKAHEKLGTYGAVIDDGEKLAKMLAPFRLTPEDLLEVARAEVVKEKLTDALVADVDDDEVWDAYELNKHQRTMWVVSTSNVPTSKEIDDYLGENADAIDAHYQKNQSRYRIPRRVRVHMVRPAPGEKVTEETMKKVAAALEKGIQPVTVAKRHKLEFVLDVELVRAENPKAFASRPASVGWMIDGPRGAYAWKVQGFEASRLQELTRPLRREIAAELARTTGLVPHARAELEAAAKILRQAKFPPTNEAKVRELQQKISELGSAKLDVVTTRKDPGGVLPGFGLAEEVVAAAFDAKVGTITEPILSRERGFVVEVESETKASRREFESNKEQHREAYRQAFRPRALQMWIEGKMNELAATVDTKPLRVKYGVLKKQ